MTFDWFTKPNNFLKVMEGNYIDRVESKKTRNNYKNKEMSIAEKARVKRLERLNRS